MSKRPNPYGSIKSRITKQEWDTLNDFFIRIEPPAQNELYASGDHYKLALMLKGLGFRVGADAFDIYEMAEEILLLGWEGDGKDA